MNSKRVIPILIGISVPILLLIVINRTGLTLQTVAGAGLTLTGLLPWMVARFRLANSFSLRPRATILVSDAIYSRVRHPIYVFGGLTMLGLILTTAWWTFLVPWVLLMGVQLVRALIEEKTLQAAFPKSYDAYRKTTWF